MPNYDFVRLLSPLDFEALCGDLLEAELGIQLEKFKEGRDGGIDLRHAPAKDKTLIVQCKRYGTFSDLKSKLVNEERPKIERLKPSRYMLATSVGLSPQNVDELVKALAPHVQSSGDIFSADRLNGLLAKHPDVERRHLKLWLHSTGVLESLLHARTHVVSQEEVQRTLDAAKLYVTNPSFQEALDILRRERVCIISGQPGIGKTTLARMLMLYFHGEGYDIIKIENDVSEARSVAYHERPRFYFYDDFLGQTAQADKLSKNEDQSLLDFMRSVNASKTSILVLTTREYILNQARLHYEKIDREKFDHRTCVVDLGKYSRRIRAQILYNHLYFSDLPAEHRTAILADRGYKEIIDHPNYNPRLIETVTSGAWARDKAPDQYLRAFLDALRNPEEIWGHAFRQQLSHRARHLLLVMTTLPSGILLEDAQRAFEQFHRRECAEYQLPRTASDFMSALKEVDGTFLANRRDNNYVFLRFQNPSIRDFMQNQILGGMGLPRLIEATVFFDQARWFSYVLAEKEPRVPVTRLLSHAGLIARTMRDLFDTAGCLEGVGPMSRPMRFSDDVGSRLADLIKAQERAKVEEVDGFIRARIKELGKELRNGDNATITSCITALPGLKDRGYLELAEGVELLAELREKVREDLGSLDDFELFANFMRIMPETFSDTEIDRVRRQFEDFSTAHAEEADYTDPSDFRDAATTMEHVSEVLAATTDSAQEILRERAGAMEEHED